MFNDFVSLFFPQVCPACENHLFKYEKFICSYCEYSLPKTNFHLQVNNPVAQLFYGRVKILSASAYYIFTKEGKVQRLIHQLKYKGQKNVGYEIGKMYGIELMKSPFFNTVDVIIPVPLHKTKIKKRGYNQSLYFAMGLSESMKTIYDSNILERVKYNETQTKKTRYERWVNVETTFALNDFNKLKGKHVLLVDDVVTTGATLEACSVVLNQVQDIKISIATIAFASIN